MSLKKHHPDRNDVRDEGDQVAKAIITLTEYGVKIIYISFLERKPVIEVRHCPATDRIESHFTGQGFNEEGAYLRKMAFVNGCQVRWNEARQ